METRNIVIAGCHCSCTGSQQLALPRKPAPRSAPEITLSDREAITLAPESPALAGVVKTEIVIGASNIGEDVIYQCGQHTNFGS